MVHRVVTVLSPGVNPFDLAVSCEVFGLRRPELGVEWYEHRLAGVVRPVLVNGGWTLDSPFGLEALDDADTVIVPACPHQPPGAMIDALRAAYDRGARMVSFCGGAFALAAAGILDGRKATTHWMDTDDLARRYPKVQVEPDVLYVDEGQVLTSAGTASGIDLALHIVRLDYGPEIANQVARRMVTAAHREGGQSQFAFTPVPVPSYSDALGSVMDWMFEHPRRARHGPPARAAGRDEPADLRPTVCRGDRHHSAAVAHPPANSSRSRPAAGHHAAGRGDRESGRVRDSGQPAPALPPGDIDDARRVSPAGPAAELTPMSSTGRRVVVRPTRPQEALRTRPP